MFNRERKKGTKGRFIRKNRSFLGFYLCPYCFMPVSKSRAEIDHIIPFSKGGLDNGFNLVASHRRCNRKKSDKISLRYIIPGLVFMVIGTVYSLAINLILLGFGVLRTGGRVAKFLVGSVMLLSVLTILLMFLGY